MIALLAALLLAAALVLPGSAAFAEELIKPTESFFVADYAGVIDEEDENRIIDKNAVLSEKTGAQIVVATVEFTGSTSIDDYCYELFNEWGIGDKKKNNGVLLLLAIGEEDYYVVAGTGLNQLLPGGVLGNMLDEYLEPDFAAGDYSEGAVKMFDALYDRLASYYKLDSGRTDGQNYIGGENRAERKVDTQRSSGGYVIFIIIVAVILLILISNVRRGIRRATGFYGYGAPFFFRPRRRGFFRSPPPPPPGGFGFGAPPRRSGSYGSSRPGGAGRSGGFSGGSSHRSGFSGGGGSTRGGGAGRGRR